MYDSGAAVNIIAHDLRCGETAAPLCLENGTAKPEG